MSMKVKTAVILFALSALFNTANASPMVADLTDIKESLYYLIKDVEKLKHGGIIVDKNLTKENILKIEDELAKTKNALKMQEKEYKVLFRNLNAKLIQMKKNIKPILEENKENKNTFTNISSNINKTATKEDSIIKNFIEGHKK